jgi:nucleoid-associated protein YgaU
MTRETKIGLLVGLAFIIVIGILLSDHLTSTTEPPPAQLAQAGNNVRQAVSVPGGAAAPIVTSVLPPAQQPSVPSQPVPTQQELTPKAPPVQIVQIGPAGSDASGQQADRATMTPPGPTAPPVTFAPETPDEPAVTQTPDAQGTDPLAAIARRFGEEVVNRDGSSAQGASASGASAAEPVRNGFREYKAGDGDTVSKMAARFFGANTQSNRDLIIKANPSLQKNPDMVVVGRTYQIPVTGSAQSAVASAPAAPSAQQPASSQGEYFYTVKPNDSLWKIATEQLGSASTISAIKDLNKDLLKGGEVVQVGMKLRLPSKPIASAAQ